MNLRDDPLQQQLRTVLRTRLAEAARRRDAVLTGPGVHAAPADETAGCPSWAVLTELEAPLFEVPAAAGGLDLGLGAALVVCEELGRAALSGPYRAVAYGVDRLCAPGTPDPARLAEALSGTAVQPLDDGAGPEVLARREIRQAAYLLGLAAGAHQEAHRYVQQRQQFGRAVYEFQAIAFPLAALAARRAATRLLVYHAGHLSDTGEPAGQVAVEALAMAGELALDTARAAMQVCGVRAMTDLVDVHRYYRLAPVEALRLGAPDQLWRRAGAGWH